MERILQIMDKQGAAFPPPPHPLIFLIPIGEKGKEFCFDLLCQLRHEQVSAEMDLSGKKLQHGLKIASSIGATFCLIVGDEELTAQKGKLKNLSTRETSEIFFTDLISSIKTLNP